MACGGGTPRAGGARGGGERSSVLPLELLHLEAAGPGPGAERSRQLRVESLILIRITRSPGASHPLSSLNAQQLWEGRREGGREGMKPARTAAPLEQMVEGKLRPRPAQGHRASPRKTRPPNSQPGTFPTCQHLFLLLFERMQWPRRSVRHVKHSTESSEALSNPKPF